MEIVLLWLDELDDLVFAGLLFWQRLRRLSLVIALIAALGLPALTRFGIEAGQVLLVSGVSLGALVIWLAFAAVSAAAANSRHSLARDA